MSAYLNFATMVVFIVSSDDDLPVHIRLVECPVGRGTHDLATRNCRALCRRRPVVQPAERLAARVRGRGVQASSDEKARARAELTDNVTGGDHASSAIRQEDQMVRDDTEQRNSSIPTADVPADVRARSFAGTNLDINDKAVAREVLSRAAADFERIFGAE